MRFGIAISTAISLAVVAVVLDMTPPAHAGPAAQPVPGRSGSTSEIARLENEIKEQRQIIIQMMQLEQQHYDLLLRLIQYGGGSTPTGAATAADPAARGTLVMPPSGAPPAVEPQARKAVERTVTVTGKVELPAGVQQEVYVFAENVHGAAVHGHTVEIAQRDKQFVPAVVVVQRGTRVVFPNYDAVYHNVFSSTSRHPFDLGSYRAGDSPRAVEMTTPGVVDVFCNMHSKMHASILVVPGPLWTRVAPDGSFRLDNVPVGTRKLVAWSPRTSAAERTVELGAAGGAVNFTLGLEPERAHSNKYGLPYGSYKD